MGANSKIEWTDASWNPIRARNLKTGKVGWHCEHATTGCEFCYAEGFNKRLGTGLPFKPGHRKDVEIFLDEEMLTLPLRWKKPRMIFVCSMTDLFAEFVSDEFIDRMFAVMALCPQHTFQVLTKRAERMRNYMTHSSVEDVYAIACRQDETLSERWRWPLPNVWLGISAERQQEWDERKEYLRETPAIVRFASFEPLVAAIIEPRPMSDFIQWAIVGGESGIGARPMQIEWARALRDQCDAADVAFFFKQWGAHVPDVRGRYRRAPKKVAGRLLDGFEYNGMPKMHA